MDGISTSCHNPIFGGDRQELYYYARCVLEDKTGKPLTRKKDIRKEFVAKRNALTIEEIAELSAQMVEQFSKLDLQGIRYLLSYYAIPERKEFDVNVCEELLALSNRDLQVAWPRMEADTLMEAVLKTKDTPLHKNKYDILEPAAGELLQPQQIDAVFVPLLAFDAQGYRVGYGKGFYDRYLSRCAQDVVKIGFSYFTAVDDIDDINEFDVPLNYCITPFRVYEF